jgi:selenocysteine lyase/cysteine desulfurase
LYVHPRHQVGDPVEHGWSNRVPLEGTLLWSEGDLIYPRGYTRGARRFDAAGIAKSLLPRLAIPGLRQLLRWTPTRIHEYLRSSNTTLAATLPQKQVRSPDPAHGLTHILGIELDSNAREYVAAGLKQTGIAASIRGNILRVSPHLWNTEEDMQQLCAILRTILQS